MRIDGFGIAGYRSFGENMVFIRDLGKVNIFIGRNNCGKSNILRFCKHLSLIGKLKQYASFNDSIDYCYGIENKDIEFAIQVKKNSAATGGIYQRIADNLPVIQRLPSLMNSIWFDYSVRSLDQQPEGKLLAQLFFRDLEDEQLLNAVSHQIGMVEGPKQLAEELARRLHGIQEFTRYSFDCFSIDAFRQITQDSTEQDVNILNGPGLIKRLAELQHPLLENRESDLPKFDRINGFMREIIGETDAELEIPSAEDVIYVSIKGKVLPLESLGTGIHELIILAAAVTVQDGAVFCIEEPEIHIHPALLKKFLKYLINKTNNQYLITSHSNACFDVPGINTYHCQLDDKGLTTCELVRTDLEKSEILSDLGCKLSDLLQSNYVIWVEGPSDRIYLNHWIAGKDSSLEEGIHYGIMFYGGRLLSHLSYDSGEINEFIRLAKLNRNAAILIDKDTDGPGKRINQTKQRIRKDFEDNGCLVWLTDGREIENYIPDIATI